jgi:hypothetical protein
MAALPTWSTGTTENRNKIEIFFYGTTKPRNHETTKRATYMTQPATDTATDTTYLAGQNPHPRDAHIHFDEGPHKYTIEGLASITSETEFTSVTTLVHQHFEHFDAKKVIAAMMRNQKKWNDPIANAKYYGKTAEEIEEMWSKAGQEAAAKGTAMHHKIECFYNQPQQSTDAAPATNSVEFQYFLNFNREYVSSDAATLKPYRTEWTVFHEEARIAGSIDMVYEMIEPSTADTAPAPATDIAPATTPASATPPQPTQSSVATAVGGRNPLLIYDWKRCREITKTNRANKFATHTAIEHIPDTNFWHYALQLNIYKYILQTKYGKTVTDLYLIVLHPEAQNYQRIKLPNLQAEVTELFEERIRNFAAAPSAE